MTCHLCDNGWSVVYGGVRFMQRVTPDMAGEGTVRSSMVSCGDSGDHKEQKHSDCDKVGELVVCSRVVPGVTESTGCTVRRARQVVKRSVSECYGRRGMVYLR